MFPEYYNLLQFHKYLLCSTIIGGAGLSSLVWQLRGSWTISEATEKWINACEIWVCRRILKIPWTDHITNNEVLFRVKCPLQLLHFLEDVMRNENKYGIIQSRVEGKRGMGKKIISWLVNLQKWYNVRSAELFRGAFNKNDMMIVNIRKSESREEEERAVFASYHCEKEISTQVHFSLCGWL